MLSGSTYEQSPTSDLSAAVAQVESSPRVKEISSKNSVNHKGKVPVDSTAMAKTIYAVTSGRSSHLSSSPPPAPIESSPLVKDKFITNSANHEGKVPVDRCTGKFKKDARLFSRCVSCRTDKPRSAFSKSQLRKNATKRRCMSCVRTYTPQY